MRLRQVLPHLDDGISLAAAYVDVLRPRPTGRPWVMVTMIASVDGAIAIDGASHPLGNRNDTAVLVAARAAADVIIVGASTARLEGYGPPSKAGQQVGVVTTSARLDPTSRLFTSGAGFLIAPESTSRTSMRTMHAGSDRVDLVAAIAGLGAFLDVPDIAVVQVEGGPTLNAQLFELDLVDEINLTISPKLVGGDVSRLAVGSAIHVRDLELAHLLVDDEGYLFSRWLVQHEERADQH